MPKCSNLSSIRDYRPISCCSIIYKCITRILANRLKQFLSGDISSRQNAFIERRIITDKVLMAQEMVRGYGRITLSPICTIKIDLQKAFDSLDWRFIHVVLLAIGLPSKFIGWINNCITISLFSLLINGGLVGHFLRARVQGKVILFSFICLSWL